MKTKTIAALTIAAALTLGLTACGSEATPKHATLEDCAATYSDKGLSPEDLATVCTRILNKVGQSEFDKTYG